MRQTIITLFAVVALAGAADANAQLTAKHWCAKTNVSCINHRQLQNLKHARYVCHHGAHQNKRWNCAAVSWLKREYNQTMAVLHPRVVRPAHYDGWMCIHKYEGAWGATNPNGHYNGLQMTWGWGELEGNPNNYSPMQILWAAEHEAQKHMDRNGVISSGWLQGQWGQTIGPCWNYFN